MELNPQQKLVVTSDAANILCLAGPGSGKTRVLTERIRYLVKEMHIDPTKIVAITFTNLAAQEMRKRLSSIAEGIWIGTLHSYANYLCIKNGFDTSEYISQKKFDRIIKRANTISRSRFETLECLLIDEGQDLDPLEFSFISRLKYKRFFIVADDRQQIYSFKGCTDEYIRDMAIDPSFKKYYLTQNYRCAPNIIKAANNYLYSYDALSPNAEAVKTNSGFVEKCSFYEAVADLKDSGNWGTWFIIARTNVEIDMILDYLEEQDIPCITFKKGDFDDVELEELLTESRVKVLTAHTAKGLECKRAIITGMRIYNEEERKIAYVAATRPKTSHS